MAVMTKRRPRPATYGNVAYDLDYLGNVAVERTAAERAYEPQPLVRPRERVRTRTRVQVREQQRVSLFAIAGFLAVAVVAVVVLMGYIQLNSVYAETVQLRSQLTELENAGVNLEARYEETFDIQTLEQAVAADGTLSYPTSEQSVYIDLSEPDNAVVYDNTEGTGGITGFFQAVGELIAAAVEYFR